MARASAPRGALLAAFLAFAATLGALGPGTASLQAQEGGRPGGSQEGEADEGSLRGLGVSPERDSERLVRGVRRLLQIRRQMGSGGRGDVARYRDAVEEYARFLKRDTVALVREAILRAEAAYARIDRAWVDGAVARLEAGTLGDVLGPRDGARLAEASALADEIAKNLAEVQRLLGEGERREIELDRTFRNLLRLGEEAKRTRGELEPLGPPPAVLLLIEEIHTTFETEVRPLRAREEGLRTIRTRFGEHAGRPGRLALVREMRVTVGKIRALERAAAEAEGGRRR